MEAAAPGRREDDLELRVALSAGSGLAFYPQWVGFWLYARGVSSTDREALERYRTHCWGRCYSLTAFQIFGGVVGAGHPGDGTFRAIDAS